MVRTPASWKARVGKRLDKVEVAQDQVALRGDAYGDAGTLQFLEQAPRALVLTLQRLVGIGHRAYEDLLAGKLIGMPDGRPILDVDELAPRLRMVREALHEARIAVLACVRAPKVGVRGEVRDGQVRFGEDALAAAMSDGDAHPLPLEYERMFLF